MRTRKQRIKKGAVYVNIQNATITTASHNTIDVSAMGRIRAAAATVRGIGNADLEQLINVLTGNITGV